MSRNVQEPVVEVLPDAGGGTKRVSKHPAYVTISAHRISGRASLFESAIDHQGWVRIEVKEAEHTDRGHHTSVHAHKIVATIDMSEAQWVAFVSRMNMGSGTPATLRYVRDGDKLIDVPELPDPIKSAEKLEATADHMHEQHRERARKEMQAIVDLLEGLPKKKAEAIRSRLSVLEHQLGSNFEYAREVLTENKETLVTEAKVEIDAMVKGVISQLGVDSLQQLAQLAQMAKPDVKLLPQSPEDPE